MIPSPVFQVYSEDGSAALSVLESTLAWGISDVRCDVGSLTLTVSPAVSGAADLLTDEDRQVRVRWAGAPDMWFLADDDGWAGISDAPDSEPRSITCRSLAGVCEEAHVSAETSYTGATPGAIVAAQFAAMQGRGFLQGITLTGGALLDAGGHAWPATVTVTYSTDATLLSILKGLSDARLIEWRMNGRALEIHKPGGDLDRTLSETLLRPGADVKAAPVQRSRRPIATDVLVVAPGGAVTSRSQSLAGRRRREVLIQQPPAATTTAAVAGDLYLAAHAAADVQLTHALQDGDDSPTPWVDYRPGDRLQTVAAGGGATYWRVAQLAVAKSSSGVTVSAELGSLLQTVEEKFADQLAHLQPGAVVLT